MAKVIKAALIAAVTVAITVAILSTGQVQFAALFTGSGALAGAHVAIQYAVVTFAGSLIAGGIGMLTSRGVNATGQNFGSKVTGKGAQVPRAIVYGETRVGGTIVKLGTSGDSSNKLHLAIVLAGHEIESLEKVYFYDDALNTTEHDLHGEKVYRVSLTKYKNTENENAINSAGVLVQYTFHNGSTDASDDHNNNAVDGLASANFSSKYPTTAKFSGLAYVYMELIYDPEKLASIPPISFRIKGKKVLDPRTGTTAWSDNPALIVRDYLMNTTYGLRATSSEINDATTAGGFAAAANTCDQTVDLNQSGSSTEKRYTANGFTSMAARPDGVLEGLLSACAGKITYTNGKFNMFVGSAQTPTLTINDEDVFDSPQFSTKTGSGDLYNGIKAVYVDKTENYQPEETPPLVDSTFLSEDTPTGEPSQNYKKILETQLPFTVTHTMAQRLQKIQLKRQREGGVLTLLTTTEFMQLQPADWVKVTNDRLSFNEKTFEVLSTSMEFGEKDGVLFAATRLVLQEVTAASYDYVYSEYGTPQTSSTNPDGGSLSVSAPTAGTITERIRLEGSTTKVDLIVPWTNHADPAIQGTEVQYKEDGETNYVTATVAQRAQTHGVINNVNVAKVYNVRIRHYSYDNVFSDWVSYGSFTVSQPNTIDAPTGLTVSTDKPFIIELKWTNPTATNFRSVELYYGTSSTFTPSSSNILGSYYGEPDQQKIVNVGIANGLDYNTDYYFKIRSINQYGSTSAFVTSGAAQVKKGTTVDLESLSANLITAGTISTDRLDVADIITTGNLITDSATISNDIRIGSGQSVFSADSDGIYLGDETFANAEFRVTPAGALNATGATISGAITATALSLDSGITIGSGNLPDDTLYGSVGGRNLISLNSMDLGNGSLTTDKDGGPFAVQKTVGQNALFRVARSWAESDNNVAYSTSFWAKASVATTATIDWVDTNSTSVSLTTSYQYFEFPNRTLNSQWMTSTYFGFFDIVHSTANTDITITISHLKIEKGTINTAWSPAIEDQMVSGNAGITIKSNKLYQGTGTFNNANTGFYLDNAGQFSLKDKLSFDGTTLSVDGEITSTSGTIGGFTLGTQALTAGSGSSAVALHTVKGIYLGDTTFNGSPFRVNLAGDLTASSATITGTITADAFTLSSGATLTDPDDQVQNTNNNAFFRYERTSSDNSVAAPSDSEFNTAFGRNPRNRDAVVVVNTTSSPNVSAAYIHNGTSFQAKNDFLTGDIIVDGTIVAANLATDSVTAAKIDVTDLSAISADLGTVTAGQLSISAGTTPSITTDTPSGKGTLLKSDGDVFFGDATSSVEANNKYVFFDQSAGTLSVKGVLAPTELDLVGISATTILPSTIKAQSYVDSSIGVSALSEAVFSEVASRVGTGSGGFFASASGFYLGAASATIALSSTPTHGTQDVTMTVVVSDTFTFPRNFSVGSDPLKISIKLQYRQAGSTGNYTTAGNAEVKTLTPTVLQYATRYTINETVTRTLTSSDITDNQNYDFRVQLERVGSQSAFASSSNGGANDTTGTPITLEVTEGTQSISTGGNADTLDNLDSTQFLRSDADDTLTGDLTLVGALKMGDTRRIELGDDTDLKISHSGGVGTVENDTGNLTIKNRAADGDIYFQSDDGTGAGTDTYFYLDGGEKKVKFNEEVVISDDLTVTGNLIITGNIDQYNVTDLDVTDKTITVNSGSTQALSDGAGLIVDRGTADDASILWSETDDQFEFNNRVQIDSPSDQILTLNQATTGWNYIGFEADGTRKFYLGNNATDGFVLGSDVSNKTFTLEGFGAFNVGSSNINSSGTISWSGGNSNNANTAYTYSQVGHLPLSGGTVTGAVTVQDNLTADSADIGEIFIGKGSSTSAHDARTIGATDNYLLIQRDGAVPIELWGSKVESRSTHYFGTTAGGKYINTSGDAVLNDVTTADLDSVGTANFGNSGSGAYKLNIHTTSNQDAIGIYATSTSGTTDQSAIRFHKDGALSAHIGLAVDAGRLLPDTAANDFAIKTWGSLHLGNGNGTNLFTFTNTGHIKVGSQTVITSGRALTNVASIDMPTSGSQIMVNAYSTTSQEGGGIFFRDGFDSSAKYNLSIMARSRTDDGSTDGLSINGYEGIAFSTGSNNYNERLFIDSSGNFDFNDGAISNAGSITSEGSITAGNGSTSLGYYVGPNQVINGSRVATFAQVISSGSLSGTGVHFANSHSKTKIRLLGSTDEAHNIGTESYNNTYGPNSWTGGTIGHRFYGTPTSLIAKLGTGGASGDLNSEFYGSVKIEQTSSSLIDHLVLENDNAAGAGGAIAFKQLGGTKTKLKSYFGSNQWTFAIDTEDTTDAFEIYDNGTVNISGALESGGTTVLSSTRRFYASDGTSVKAAYSFDGDSGTGISHTATGRIDFLSSGVIKAYIKTGTSNPISPTMYVDGRTEINGVVTWSGGSSTNANTAYTYSQVGHVPLAGGTMTGTLNFTSAADPLISSQYGDVLWHDDQFSQDLIKQVYATTIGDYLQLRAGGNGPNVEHKFGEGYADLGGYLKIDGVTRINNSGNATLGTISSGAITSTGSTNVYAATFTGATGPSVTSLGLNVKTLDGANDVALLVEKTDGTDLFKITGQGVGSFSQRISVQSQDITGTRIQNWQTAYGWGDHSTAGYLTSSSAIAATQLTGTINNARLNSDVLITDGGTYSTGFASDLDTITGFRIHRVTGFSGTDHRAFTSHHNLLQLPNTSSSGPYEVQLAFTTVSSGTPEFKFRSSATNWTDWVKVFNDGYHPNADKWTTARTLSLTGAVTGSVSWDGSGNASLATSVGDLGNVTATDLLVDGTTHASIRIDRASTSYHNNLLYYTNGSLTWRIWQSGADNTLAIRNEGSAANVITMTNTDTVFANNVTANGSFVTSTASTAVGIYAGSIQILEGSTRVLKNVNANASILTSGTLPSARLSGTYDQAVYFSNNTLRLKGHMFFNEHSAGRHYIHFATAESTNRIDWRIQTNSANNTIHSWTESTATFRTKMHINTGSGGNSVPTNYNLLVEDNANAVIALSVPETGAGGLFFPRGTAAYYSGIERANTTLHIKHADAAALSFDSNRDATFSGYVKATNLFIGATSSDLINVHTDSTNGQIATYRNNSGYFIHRTYADYNNDGTTVEFQQRVGADGNYSSIGNFSAHDFHLRTNNTNRITIGSAGNVSISNALSIVSGIDSNTGGAGTNLFRTNTSDGRVLRLRDRNGDSGNIIQFEQNNGSGIWEIVGRSSTFYVYKNGGTGSGFKWQIDSSGDHTITGNATFSANITSAGTIVQYESYNDSSKLLGSKLITDAGSTSYTHPYLDMRRWTGVSSDHYAGSIEVAPTNADAASIVFYSDTVSTNTKASTERFRIHSNGDVRIADGALQIGTTTVVASTRRFYASNGTAVKAAYSFDGDSTTGISRTAAGRIDFLSSGAIKAYIKTGTSNPISPTMYVDGRTEINGVVTWTGGSSTNANTAYGWGDHSTQGYITNATASLDASKITSGIFNSARIPVPANGSWWNNGYVRVQTDGVMEVGKYLDFHTSNSGGNTDFDVRVTATTGAIDIDGDLTVDDITASDITTNGITTTGILTVDTSPAANGTGDLKIIHTLNSASGVGYAGQVIGVNIEDSINTSNQPEQNSTWGGVTGATAIALQADDNTYGQFQVWTSPQSSSAGTALTPRFWIAGSGNATFLNNVTTNSSFVTSTASSSLGIYAGSTQVFEGSTRNLKNIGTISSGSISSSGTLSASSYAAVGAIVAADPGSAYYSYNNRIGSGLAVVGTFNNFGNTVVSGTGQFENIGIGIAPSTPAIKVYHTNNYEAGEFITNTGGSLIRYRDSTNTNIEIGIQAGLPVIRTGSVARLTVDGSDLKINSGALKIANTSVISSGRFLQNVTLEAGAAGARFKASDWHQSADGKNRFYFASNSHTYYRTGNAFIYRNNGDAGVATIDAAGRARLQTSSDQLSIGAGLQVGNNTFTGANGVYSNSRLGIMLNGSLKSYVYASTYNDANYPDYGFVFIHGGSTSSYNVWSISPDGPAKGNALNFIYGNGASNIHTGTPKVVFDGGGNVDIKQGALQATKNGYQLRLQRQDFIDDDWRLYSWQNGLNFYPQSSSTVYFGRDGASTNVSVYNGNLVMGTGDTTIISSARNVENINHFGVANTTTVDLKRATFTYGASDANFQLAIANGSGNTTNSEQAWLGLYYGSTKRSGISFHRSADSRGGDIVFSTWENTTRMRIDDSTGNVGIGISPNTTMKLTVGGSISTSSGSIYAFGDVEAGMGKVKAGNASASGGGFFVGTNQVITGDRHLKNIVTAAIGAPLSGTFPDTNAQLDIASTTAQTNFSSNALTYGSDRASIVVDARHSSTKDGTLGYAGPMMDFRSHNASYQWSVAQIIGTVDPEGGSVFQGGLVFSTSGGGTTNPTGRRDQGAAPTARMLIGAGGNVTILTGDLKFGTSPTSVITSAKEIRNVANANIASLRVGHSSLGTTGAYLHNIESTGSYLLLQRNQAAPIEIWGSRAELRTATYFGSSSDAHGYVDTSGNATFEGNITAYGSPSDIRLKENVERIADPIDKVKQLDGVTFDYKKDGSRSTGLIAQQLLEVLPEVVYETKDLATGEEHYAVRYGNVVGLLVEAMKEQQETIESLTKRIEELENGDN